ncbi:hypothetical protein S245_051645, partial [Arachis hypogaea]
KEYLIIGLGIWQLESKDSKDTQPKELLPSIEFNASQLGSLLQIQIQIQSSLLFHAHHRSEHMHKLDPGSQQFEFSENTNQIGSSCLENEQKVLISMKNSTVFDEKLHQGSDNMRGNSLIQLSAPPQYVLVKSSQIGEGSCDKKVTVEPELAFRDLSDYNSQRKSQPASQNVQNGSVESTNSISSLFVQDQMQPSPAQENMSSVIEHLDLPTGDVAGNDGPNCLQRKSKRLTQMRLKSEDGRTPKLLKGKYTLRSSRSSDRALQSQTREKCKVPELSSDLIDVKNVGEKKRRGRKRKQWGGEGIIDEFSRIRSHLRYLLNRVSYEQSLIDAYSGEGWKGYSIEKLKPEKELQRAKSEILRRKLKIRDLFWNLGLLCAEGKLPESLFDSEGAIRSDDIFCAKCGSKELTTDNDIILCDGACDRGFHQCCLSPPLLTKDIPPGHDIWLCPGCNCKLECIKLLNDFLGTSLSIRDTWERVFPEATEAAGTNAGHSLGLPSVDSDDNDYKPKAPEDEEDEGGESSSDGSDYASDSEKLKDLHSEDDDYDPNAPDTDREASEENSSSGFISDDTVDEAQMLAPQDDIMKCKSSRSKKFKVG